MTPPSRTCASEVDQKPPTIPNGSSETTSSSTTVLEACELKLTSGLVGMARTWTLRTTCPTWHGLLEVSMGVPAPRRTLSTCQCSFTKLSMTSKSFPSTTTVPPGSSRKVTPPVTVCMATSPTAGLLPPTATASFSKLSTSVMSVASSRTAPLSFPSSTAPQPKPASRLTPRSTRTLETVTVSRLSPETIPLPSPDRPMFLLSTALPLAMLPPLPRSPPTTTTSVASQRVVQVEL